MNGLFFIRNSCECGIQTHLMNTTSGFLVHLSGINEFQRPSFNFLTSIPGTTSSWSRRGRQVNEVRTHMKKKVYGVLFLILGFFEVQGHARTFKCTSTRGEEFLNSWTVEMSEDTNSLELRMRVMDSKPVTQVVARLDPHFRSVSYSQNSANSGTGSHKFLKYADRDSNFMDSESGETGIYVSRSLLEGKSGYLNLTTKQMARGEAAMDLPQETVVGMYECIQEMHSASR